MNKHDCRKEDSRGEPSRDSRSWGEYVLLVWRRKWHSLCTCFGGRLCARASVSSLVNLYSKPGASGLIKSRLQIREMWLQLKAGRLGSSHSSALLLRKEISAVRGQGILSGWPFGQGHVDTKFKFHRAQFCERPACST